MVNKWAIRNEGFEKKDETGNFKQEYLSFYKEYSII